MADTPTLRVPARSTDDRVVAGVCAGIANAVGLDPVLIRIATIVLAITGSGVPLYLVGWLLMPAPDSLDLEPEESKIEVRRGVGLALVVLGAILTLRALDLAPPDEIVWPVILVGIGIGVVVWQIQPQLEATRWEALRIGAGIVVVGAGIVALVAGNISIGAIRDSLFATTLVVGGLALIIGPWIAVLMRDRADERTRRLQADARADMAAHLHDSVLQTFALIQRTDDPDVIVSLARQQERELRRWLYSASDDPSASTLKSAVESLAATIEDRHDITVEVVVVGDLPLDSSLEALLGATGEAATNAAKWSGCDRVAVFVEVEDDTVTVFVRDTGTGFDPDSVAEDRLGVRESIIGRMERAGGSARIASTPGEGTEVEVSVPRPGAGRRDTV